MKLALIFRGNSPYTTGWAFKKALEYLKVDFDHIDDNELMNRQRSASHYDAALKIDDGFGFYPLHTLPDKNAVFAIDLFNELPADMSVFNQFHKIYSANYSGGVLRLAQHGIASEFLPNAWDSLGIKHVPDLPRAIPITWAASWSTEYRWLMKEIVEHKYKGYAGNCFFEDLGMKFSTSKMGLNILGGIGHLTKYNQVNLRTFDVMGCGALLIQQSMYDPLNKIEYPDMAMMGLKSVDGWWMGYQGWERKKSPDAAMYVSWRDASQLFETIDYYLRPENEEERRAIAKRGQDFVTNNHTFIHRVRKILSDFGYTV